MKITLYQIIPELDNDHLMFREFQFIQTASGNRVPAEIYEAVYQGELDIQTLEDAFYIFNMEHPEGYKGRSMSVSDVVEIFDSEIGYRFYFCDTIGFKPIAFDREKAVPVRYGKDQEMKEMTLNYKGRDSWSRPVYEANGRLYVDVDPRKDWKPNICTKYNNEFDGEPDEPISEDTRITFVPGRDTWD